ncbi:hypothetical protein Pla110_32420 [Polystyrenella longa]|uniref:Leucine Rich repeats (2 copies) n=1 Tax=Polystyrenella longa TaxID=2528007 RepID=A0A518CQL5_9PLAN|nr:leucine-rich repeat domain-containing protein [Polystyrenella longa]QDU81500.1 hypothetical protein Pla110_32420 [Polystyrenella longa]
MNRYFDLSGVRYIGLSGPEITEAAIPVPNGCPELKELQLTYTSITTSGLSQLTVKDNITSLQISTAAVSDEFFAHPSQFPQLQQLFLNSDQLTNDGLSSLCQISSLRTLHLTQSEGVTNAVMDHIAYLNNLDRLSLHNVDISRFRLDLKSPLTHLHITGEIIDQLPDQLVEQICNTTSLKTLELEQCSMTEADLLRICDLPLLTCLNIPNMDVTSAVIEKIATKGRFDYLGLSADRITEQQVSQLNELSAFPDLRLGLNFQKPKESATAYDHLLVLQPETTLRFTRIKLTEKHRRIFNKKNVASIQLVGVTLPDDGLKSFKRTNPVWGIRIYDVPLSISDVRHIAKYNIEDELILFKTGLDETMIPALFEQSSLPRYLDIKFNKLTRDTRDQLLEQFPQNLLIF